MLPTSPLFPAFRLRAASLALSAVVLTGCAVLEDKALALRVVEAVQSAFEDREPVPIVE